MPQRIYQGHRVAFLTQHGKQTLLQAPLETALGCHLVHTQGVDTDSLGSFTRETDRAGSQLDAARQKAHLGMSLTGAQIGLASEGAFSPDPYTGLMMWDTELLLWVDRGRQLEIPVWVQGPGQSLHRTVRDWPELMAFAQAAQFPSHQLVLRPDHPDHPSIFKGVGDEQALAHAFERAMALSEHGCVFVENDLRAFANPTRQDLIRQAGQKLVQRLLCTCPACNAPGYAVMSHLPGRACRACGAATRLPVAELWRCLTCGHEHTVAVPDQTLADPMRCDQCNP